MRQYIAQKNLDSQGLLTIIGKDYRYLHNVLRLLAGDMIYVRLPSGELAPMTVCKIDEPAKKIILQVCNLSENGEKALSEDEIFEKGENLPSFRGETEFFLFMAVPKSAKFDQIVRQATECGISRIIPVQTEFSQKGSEKMNFRSERFERIIKEARQQSGSPVDTVISECMNLKSACEFWESEIQNLKEEEKLAVVLYERNDETVTVREACEKKQNLKKLALFCGSEGGLSPEEVKKLCGAGFKAVHLKTNILRCETAALYGISALQSILF
ncbi:MAG: 16S rRNA (uracil(1498)-N(3))-methyltransferase [Treponema sp.]|nr:16S rRNA (uracil(1498)-N(3))-methyltransferase [Treponema sp.]